jgi:hypothetical protein
LQTAKPLRGFLLIYRNTASSLSPMGQGSKSRSFPKMTKPIPDKAEIALEYPDKFYVGTFEHTSRFEAHLDPAGIALILERPGSEDVRKSIHMHIHFGLFADILRELASTVARVPKDDILHRDQLAQAAGELHAALLRA